MNRITERALNWALEIAGDDSHGYSQTNRWGPDYDCSSFIISAYEQAGLKLKEEGASYTGNMKTAFLRCGFTALPKLPLSRLEPGDVLLNEQNHTVMYIGDGKVVASRSSDGFPQSGDQSSREICIQNYYDYPWDFVLRYTGMKSSGSVRVPCSVSLPVLSKGSKGIAVQIMQELLISAGFNCGPDGADGDFGPNTAKAMNGFQSARELAADNICGKETWEELFKI